jgi:hypothetical protein
LRHSIVRMAALDTFYCIGILRLMPSRTACVRVGIKDGCCAPCAISSNSDVADVAVPSSDSVGVVCWHGSQSREWCGGDKVDQEEETREHGDLAWWRTLAAMSWQEQRQDSPWQEHPRNPHSVQPEYNAQVRRSLDMNTWSIAKPQLRLISHVSCFMCIGAVLR